jgi:hypothetical protein
MSVDLELVPKTKRPAGQLPVQSPAECVRKAHEQLAFLDQVDIEAGSTTVVRRLLRTDALDRLARCGPLIRRHRSRLQRLVSRKRARRAESPPTPR